VFVSGGNKIIHTDGTVDGTKEYSMLSESPNLLVPLWPNTVCAIFEQHIEIVSDNVERIQLVEDEQSIAYAKYVATKQTRKLLYFLQQNYNYELYAIDLTTNKKELLTQNESSVVVPLYVSGTGDLVTYFWNNVVWLYNTDTGSLTDIYHQTKSYVNGLSFVGQSLYLKTTVDYKETLTQFNPATSEWRTLYTITNIHGGLLTQVEAAPSTHNPNQVMVLNSEQIRLCDFTGNVSCADAISLDTSLLGIWISARNEYIYYSTNNNIIKVSGDTNTESVLVSKVSKKIQFKPYKNPPIVGLTAFKYNPVDDYFYFTAFEMKQTAPAGVYQVHLNRLNITSGEVYTMYELCNTVEAKCDMFAQSVFILSDGTMVLGKGTTSKNKLVSLIPDGVTPKPRKDLTWLIVIGSLVGVFTLIVVVVLVSVAVKSTCNRTKGYTPL
jgi:hypothetical protein